MLILVFSTFFIFKDFLRISKNEKLGKISFSFFMIIISLIIFISKFYLDIYDHKNQLLIFSLVPIIIFSSMFYIDKRVIYFLPILDISLSIFFYNENFGVLNKKIIFYLILLSIFYFLIYLIEKFENKDNQYKKILFAFSSLFILSLFSALLYNFLFNIKSKDIIFIFFISLIFNFICCVAYFFFLRGIISFLNNISNLDNLSSKDNISFYKIALYKEKLLNYIKENEIEVGALCLFEFSKEILNNINKEFILSFFKENLEKRYKDIIFLRVYSKTYAFFIPLKKEEIDIKKIHKNNSLGEVDENFREKDCFHQIIETINDINFEDKKISIGISLYGVNSYDIDELSFISNKLLSISKMNTSSNHLIVYDYSIDFENINEKLIVENFFKENKIKINFYKTIFDSKIYYTEYKDSKTNEIFDFSKLDTNEKKLVIRYLSLLSIKNFFKDKKNNKLIISYSVKYLSDEIVNMKRFKNKIKKYTSLQNILIGLDFSNSKDWDTKTFLENYKTFLDNKFNFVLFSNNQINEINFNNIKFKYIINKREITNKFLKLID